MFRYIIIIIYEVPTLPSICHQLLLRTFNSGADMCRFWAKLFTFC